MPFYLILPGMVMFKGRLFLEKCLGYVGMHTVFAPFHQDIEVGWSGMIGSYWRYFVWWNKATKQYAVDDVWWSVAFRWQRDLTAKNQNISTEESLRNFWLWHSEAAMHIIGKELYQEQQLHISDVQKLNPTFSTAINDNQVEKMTHFHQWQLFSFQPFKGQQSVL